MHTIIFFLSLVAPLTLFADTARIHSITPTFIKFEDGRVGFLDEVDNEVLNQLRPGNLVSFKLKEDSTLQDVMIEARREADVAPVQEIVPDNFIPSLLPNYTYATNLLHTFRYPPLNDAQCYDKAHIWVYESSYYYRVNLMKAWIFFADHYIQRYRYKWWFHIAPLAKVKMKTGIEDRVLDRSFHQYPLKLKLWTDLFMHNKATCKEVTSYYDYSQHPNEDDCYVIRSNPYYWQPKHLEARARDGQERKEYIRWELIYAYKYGFGLHAQ